MTPLLKSQLYVHLPPEKLFGQRITPMTGVPQKIVFVASHETPDTTVTPMDPLELAQRMVFSLQEERMLFMSYYWKFRFAFPDRANEFIERSEVDRARGADAGVRGQGYLRGLPPLPGGHPAAVRRDQPGCWRRRPSPMSGEIRGCQLSVVRLQLTTDN